MKKLAVLSFVVLYAANLFAAPVEPLNDVTRHVAAYLPYIRMLIFIIAVLVGIGGGIMVTYMKMINQEANVKPRIIATAASCVTLIFMAITLPQFFGYEADGSASRRLTGNFQYGGASIYDEFSGDYIKTEIPGLESDKWITFPSGTNKQAMEMALSLWQNAWHPGISDGELRNEMCYQLEKMDERSEISPEEGGMVADCFDYIFKNK